MVIKMRLTKLALFLFSGVAFVSVGMQGVQAAIIPGSELLGDYLVIATGDGTDSSKFEAFNMSNTEIGADQEVLSKADSGHPARVGSLPLGSVPSLRDVFGGTAGAMASFGGNRWDDTDWAGDGNGQTAGVPDRLQGARPLFEGIDYSGNVAITGPNAKFGSSNSDVNATMGIRCNAASAIDCFPSPSSTNTHFANAADAGQSMNTLVGNGVFLFDPTDLNAGLVATRDFIVGLQQETLFASSSFDPVTGLPHTTGEGLSSFDAAFVNRNIKDVNTTVVTDLDAIDLAGNGDGFAVIDINAGANAFNVTNTDWILQSTKGTIAIFRLVEETTQYKFANSSILLGDGSLNSNDIIDELGAVFFTDAYKGTNAVIDLSNVVLGGAALWDFTDFNPNRGTRLSSATSAYTRPGNLTLINMQNAQGCSQFISDQVLMSNNRWNRCAQVASVPEPSAWLLMGFGLLGVEMIRRTRRVRV